jgi:filamentous hemagglutinin family protein
MNRIYRLVWSHVNQAWVAVAENAKGHGKSISARKLVATAAALMGGSLLASSAYAANAGDATVVGGNGSVTQNGNTTTINQTSQRLAIDWTGLSTAANEALVFNQPNASAIALNRITGSSPSTLLGSLTANGQVYILNPNGVLFGGGAQVNVGGMVASTLTMNANDFMNGGSTFTKDPNATGDVENKGTLTAADGGYIALLSGTVRNEGTIDAPLGTALLAAGDKVTLNVNNGSLIGYTVDQGDLNALVENKQMIRADGGQVIMLAKALDALSTAVINNTGIVEARTVQNKNGHILLLGDMDVGTVNVGGTLDVSAPTTGDGGKVETSAAHVKVADGTVVTGVAVQGLTGSWLIDPVDFTVAASGGDMTGAALSANLGTIDTAVQSTSGHTAGSGDININDAVSWNAATTLTLNAQNNININQSITSSNASGKVALLYGQSSANGGSATYNVRAPINLQAGNNFSTKLGSNGPLIQYRVITSLGSPGSYSGVDLQGVNYGNYVLGSNIDASATATWDGGVGFRALNYGPGFSGIFDGLGHVISNLTVHSPLDFGGLFTEISVGGIVRNVGLVNVNVSTTAGFSGGLVGINYGTISNSYVTGNVTGSFPGGMGTIATGGLAGVNYGTVDGCYAAVTVSGMNSVTGGLVGVNRDRDGFIATISNSYATGSVSVSDRNNAGGLVGSNYGSAKITNSYATGSVTGGGYTGGLAGVSDGGITGSFWNTTISGMSSGVGFNYGSSGIVGIDNTAASQLTTFKNAGWDIDATGGSGAIWRIYDGQSGPLLRAFLTQITVTSGAAGKTYDGTTNTVGGAYSTSINGAVLGGSLSYITSKNAGSYSMADGTLTGTGLFSGQQGYDIIYVGGSETIGKANVTLSASGVTKTYDGTTAAAGSAIATAGTIFAGDSLSGGSFAFTDKNAGSGKTVTASGVTINDGNGGNNYNVTYANNTSSVINKADVTLSTTAVTKTYNGTTAASGTADVTAGTIFGSDSLSGGSFAFTDKNAGSGNKTVTVSGITVNDGNGGNNYNVSYANNTTSTINKANVTVSTSNVTKTYDGTTSAAGTAVATAGTIFSGDSISGGSFAFTDKNAGSGDKSVTASGATIGDGVNNSNYNITYANNTTSTINKANVTVSTSNVTKTYDGTTSAAGTADVTAGQLFGSDSLSGGAFAFTDKNAGSGNKSVTASGVTVNDGNSGNNYNVTYANNTTSTINKANVTVSTSNVTKTYDGTTSAAGTAVATAGTIFSGDSISGGSFAFTDKNAGTGDKSVTASGATIGDGVNNSNYNITYANNTTSTINKADVTVSASNVTKTYDGTTSASGTAVATAGTIFSGDSISGGSFAFTDKNAGTGDKSVTTSGATIGDGVNNSNYNVTYANNTTSTINKADLAVTANAADKVYDGTTAATVTYTDNRIAGDSLSFTGTASFADKNVGNGKTIAVGSVGLAGADAGNYNLFVTSGTSADITPASLTVSANGAGQFFDGRAFTGGNGVTINGLVNGETVADLLGTLGYSGSSQGATAIGNYIITPGGLSSANYRISFVDGVLSIKAISQASAALGGATLEQPYNGVQKTIADTAASDAGGQTAQSEDKSSDKPIVVANNNSGASAANKVTPRLDLVGCGMSMPAGGGC